MKLLSVKRRARDISRSLKNRRGKRAKYKSSHPHGASDTTVYWKGLWAWIETEQQKGLEIRPYDTGSNKRKNYLEIVLPNRMNFYKDYATTVQTLTAIRKFSDFFDRFSGRRLPARAPKIGSVCFDELESISTSAALVLTAEMSKWDTSVRKQLQPRVNGWSDKIYSQFEQLGFFDLFDNKPEKICSPQSQKPNVEFVRYVKGCCGNVVDTKEKRAKLKSEVINLVGSSVPKWMILHSGISEAVTNVTHHAYPKAKSFKDKSWYLTGSFNQDTKELKIAFYDQGIGIPNSLPESKVWEKVLAYFTKWNILAADRARDMALIKAAVSIDRTSTEKNDRGKGLQDLIEFIRELGSGYLSIMSYKGLYKCSIDNGVETIKSESFDRPLSGTLIIWSVVLNEGGGV